MRLVQYRETSGHRAVAAIADGQAPAQAQRLQDVENSYELALEALEIGKSLLDTVRAHGTDAPADLERIARDARLLAPLEHPVPTRCWITGVDGDRCWFYRGNGASLVGAGQPLPLPDFALGAEARPALVGLYVLGDDGLPCRLGWALGNDFADPGSRSKGHAAEAKLRTSAVGPELWLGQLPRTLAGSVRLVRQGEVLEQRPFEVNAKELPIAELESALFRYPMFRRPGDVHLLFSALGPETTAAAQPGDECEIRCDQFAMPLTNPLAAAMWRAPKVKVL